MRNSIHRANIDRCLELVNDSNLASDRRGAMIRLLIEEEDKLAYDQEQLQFAESRAAKGRELINQIRYLRDGEHVDGERADQLIATFEMTQRLLEGFCDQLLAKVMTSRL